MPRAIVGLGSNLGDRHAMLCAAVAELGTLGQVVAGSDVFETSPVGGAPQGDFLNAAVALETELDPFVLLEELLLLETRLGRVRTETWGPRTIDLDLLFYADVSVTTERLVLPHPRVHERAFARYPAAQVGAPLEPGPEPGPNLGPLLPPASLSAPAAV
jgi:2-amino-4-hydroxy-6-hydroxymethyldihydropteridine diphosphokinase